MNILDARILAVKLMRQHGLIAEGWKFQFNNRKRGLGVCKSGRKIIELSRHFVAVLPDDEITDTILHEIAHAIAGHKAGHGPQWQAVARRIGAKPDRCYDGKVTVSAPAVAVGTCKCTTHKYYRMPKHVGRICRKCRERFTVQRVQRQSQPSTFKPKDNGASLFI